MCLGGGCGLGRRLWGDLVRRGAWGGRGAMGIWWWMLLLVRMLILMLMLVTRRFMLGTRRRV